MKHLTQPVKFVTATRFPAGLPKEQTPLNTSRGLGPKALPPADINLMRLPKMPALAPRDFA
jgi:hypothetical protein